MTYKACGAGGVVHPYPVGAVVRVEVLAAVLVEAASPAHLGKRRESEGRDDGIQLGVWVSKRKAIL
jgi:hypothetical protein